MMIISRRAFINSSILAGAGLMFGSKGIAGEFPSPSLLGVHPFILHNPGSVFIMKTNVDVKTNYDAIKSVGLDFGRSVFGITDNPNEGVPLSTKIVIKPNLTCRQRDRDIYSRIGSMGIVTDAYFVEGIVESLKELNLNQFFIREINCGSDFDDGNYVSMASRAGIDLKGLSTSVERLSPGDVEWISIPKGVWFKMIPYLWPVNSDYTFLLNIAKFKAHSMGLTLCAKNLQGTIAYPYQAHCAGNVMPGIMSDHVSYTAYTDISDNYNRHLKNGVPRWDKPGDRGGMWQEFWATRCLDNNSATIAGLHIIEGIYGRDGNFLDGPGPGDLATDYMTNYIIFGKNQFYVDIIGHYLGGHEPGNFGLFHMARERGMISKINPMDIPVYEWSPASGPVLADLSGFTRYPLKTLYLQRNYNGNDEPLWHMVDEPFDYGTVGINDVVESDGFNFGMIFPNPVFNSTSISFHIPGNGHVSIEILNSDGMIAEVLVNKNLTCGDHTLCWDSNNHPAGLYICRMLFKGFSRTMKIIVLH